jgi:hypothetical protein
MAFTLEYSTVAKCRPEHIWQKFQKLEEWAWWNRVIGQARWLEGQPWQKGSRFLMELVRPRVIKFEPVITVSEPPNRICWVGKGKGVTGEHWFTFEEQPDGTTLLKTWENFSGLSSIFFGSGTKAKIVDMYKIWLDRLKEESEKIAREELARK